MSKDQVYGILILVGSIVGIIAYAWFIYVAPLITLQISAFVAVALILGIIAWIGYTLATTPPPAPIEELEKELETEAEKGKTEKGEERKEE